MAVKTTITGSAHSIDKEPESKIDIENLEIVTPLSSFHFLPAEHLLLPVSRARTSLESRRHFDRGFRDRPAFALIRDDLAMATRLETIKDEQVQFHFFSRRLRVNEFQFC